MLQFILGRKLLIAKYRKNCLFNISEDVRLAKGGLEWYQLFEQLGP